MEHHPRQNPRLSACGLNCGLCPRFHTDGPSKCPGCNGEGLFTKRPSCKIISCCIKHENIEYCYLCSEYPCEKYNEADKCDSFITHKNMLVNFANIKDKGLDEYQKELDEKIEILSELINHYNDGRKKSFFCLAVDLLDLEDVKSVMSQIKSRTYDDDPIKEKAATATELFRRKATGLGIELKLNKKHG